jgi:hypothetical protein
MEAADAGGLGPAAKGEVEGVVAEAAASASEPQRRSVSEAVLSAQPQVTVKGASGLRAERQQPSLTAALAPPDMHRPGTQIQILDLEGDCLAGT